MTNREQFEALISAPPYELPVARYGENSGWPGQYKWLEVQLAWEFWEASTKRLISPSQAMVDAAEEAHMPFGDMALAVSSAVIVGIGEEE